MQLEMEKRKIMQVQKEDYGTQMERFESESQRSQPMSSSHLNNQQEVTVN